MYTYILLCSFSFIMLLLFSDLLSYFGKLKYDFETDRIYFFNILSKTLPKSFMLNDEEVRSEALLKAGLTPIIYDKQLIWGIIKPSFRVNVHH